MLKKNFKYIILIVVLLIGIIGISYAFFEYYGENKNSSLIFGNIYLKLDDGTSTLSLSNIFPETKEEARARTDNTVTFSIKGINTTTNKDIWYEVTLNDGDEEEGKTRFDAKDLVFDLVEVDENGNETMVVDAQSFDNLDSVRLWVNQVSHDVTTEINRTYTLRAWLNENVTISDTNPNATYKASEFKNMYASIKVGVNGDFVDRSILGRFVYNVDGLDVETPAPTNIYSDRVSNITDEVTGDDIIGLIGWSTTQDGELEYRVGSEVSSSDITNGDITLYPVIETQLSEIIKAIYPLTDAASDIDGTRYVNGEVDNNYLWYSGKLWRIMAINSDNTVKLVTQGNMTAVAWNTTSTNTVYENSQIHNWLNNEFLPTLANTDTLLVDSTWDYTTYADFPTAKLTTTNSVTEKVGLLNIYEFMKTGGTNSSDTTNTFLNNGYQWWTMSPQTDSSNVWYVNKSGYAVNNSPTSSIGGVRPSVNLKSDIQIMGGSGTKSNPYVIGGDKDTGLTSELLSNRISGEYINFNDVLYRIVGTEEINEQTLTKITMADYSLNKNSLTSMAFGASTSETIYSPTYGIGLYLEEWYQADSTSETYATTYIKDNYKVMIATSGENGDGVEWYTGPTSGTGYDYTLSKTGDIVSATIGLPYYGEMFSSHFGDGNSSAITFTWTMTKYSSSQLWFFFANGNPVYGMYSNSSGVRPSMYLKSNVKIVSGNGQPNSPYEITI